MTTTPENCRRCGRNIYPRRRHATGPAEPLTHNNAGRYQQRPGYVMHCTRGLCQRCARASKADGTLGDYPRLSRIGDGLLEDFQFIAETTGTRAAGRIGWDKRTRTLAARRLGVTVASLDRALYRDAERHAA